ncbi:S10 family peptidase [Chthonobacter albigriseus]|uniref:S10 family peptidase n=1 Tax=Chthonobacter albigriseus TaxID=1683161 RepID=UPI001FCEC85C|nr:peptidase S10 [Chthonobacter albigriseus]
MNGIAARMMAATLTGLVALQGAGAPAWAQEVARPTSGILALIPKPSVTQHTLTIAGRAIDYTAEAGTLPIRGGNGDVTAEIFFTSYVAADAPPGGAKRPVTFVFNGGPGAASAYLHIGAIGPRVLATAPDGSFLPPPSRLIDNADSWLPATDLVFVDPPGTGYSRAPGSEGDSRFWGVNADQQAMGAFIRLWLQKSGRTGAPVVLAGESYGGFRAALLAKTLQEDIGIAPVAAILISPALEFSLLYGEDYNPLTWALPLPAMAAVNLERQGVTDSATLASRLKEVEAYASGPYVAAISGGLESGGKSASETVARMIGLPRELVERHNARVPTSVFAKEFERAAGQVLSRYDGSISAPDATPGGGRGLGPDPVLDRSVPVLTSAFVTYVRDELGFKTDISYRLLNGEIAGRWDYGTSASRQGYAGVLEDLQEARVLNPALRVLITHGFTDLITPYFASSYLVGQLPTLKGAEPIRLVNYAGGHMMYFRPESRRELTADAIATITGGD